RERPRALPVRAPLTSEPRSERARSPPTPTPAPRRVGSGLYAFSVGGRRGPARRLAAAASLDVGRKAGPVHPVQNAHLVGGGALTGGDRIAVGIGKVARIRDVRARVDRGERIGCERAG